MKKNVTIHQYLDPKYVPSTDKNLPIPFQIDISWLKTFKDFDNPNFDNPNALKFYYVYLISTLYIRNQIMKYKKLSKEDRKTIKSQNLHPVQTDGMFFNVKIDDIISFASLFTTKRIFKNYFDELLNSNFFDMYFDYADEEDKIHILSTNNLSYPGIEYDPNKRIEVSLPVYKSMNFNNFTKLCVRILAEMPLKVLNEEFERGDFFVDIPRYKKTTIISNTSLSYKAISKICKITEARVSQILKPYEKLYVIEEITEEEYLTYSKTKDRFVIKVLSDFHFDEETGELKNIYKYYKFSNTIVKSQSGFKYRFSTLFEADSNEEVEAEPNFEMQLIYTDDSTKIFVQIKDKVYYLRIRKHIDKNEATKIIKREILDKQKLDNNSNNSSGNVQNGKRNSKKKRIFKYIHTTPYFSAVRKTDNIQILSNRDMNKNFNKTSLADINAPTQSREDETRFKKVFFIEGKNGNHITALLKFKFKELVKFIQTKLNISLNFLKRRFQSIGEVIKRVAYHGFIATQNYRERTFAFQEAMKEMKSILKFFKRSETSSAFALHYIT